MRLTHYLAALPLAAAWPAAIDTSSVNVADEDLLDERARVYPKVPKPKFNSGRDNCGVHGKCTVFDEQDQFVDVRPGSGHEFKAPGPRDLRGQCPGLNAAANHGFIPHDGILTIAETIKGLNEAYSMSRDLGAALAVLSIVLSGDPIAMTWSIGEGYAGSVGLLGQPYGIAGTHNAYEGDASIVRGDAYMHGGNVGFFEMHRWEHLFSLLGKKGLTHDKAAAQAYYTAEYSRLNNPYYFSGPVSGLVAPDAHNFVVNFMSNHSAANKGGDLKGNVLKAFFSVKGTPGNFRHIEGKERIPFNWYKRPSSQPMNTVDTNVDTVINNQIYPGVIKFGGNTGKRDSFVGIDFAELTGGVFNGPELFKGNTLTCFFLQATQAGLSSSALPLLRPIGQLRQLLQKTLGPQAAALGCPQLDRLDNSVFKKYPGAAYTGRQD